MDIPDNGAEHERAERGRTLVAAAAAGVQAPPALRVAVQRDRARAAGAPPRRRRGGWLLGGLAGAVAATVVAVVIAGGSGAGSPSVLAVAGLSLKPAQAPAPATRPDAPRLLDADVDGVAFPYWDDRFGWHPTGVRREQVSGRRTTTVYYEDPAGARLGYTIVGGDALAPPSGRDVVRGATTLRLVHHGARTIVTWRRGGHTCVISAPDAVPEENLLALAAWKGAGTAAF